jgi:hypothetical protein
MTSAKVAAGKPGASYAVCAAAYSASTASTRLPGGSPLCACHAIDMAARAVTRPTDDMIASISGMQVSAQFRKQYEHLQSLTQGIKPGEPPSLDF